MDPKAESAPVSKWQGMDPEYLANPKQAEYRQICRIAHALERIADSLNNIEKSLMSKE
jgi:hypothetical protein